MIVVADTGPIHYLVLIGTIDLLPALYRTVVIPSAVASELSDQHTPLPVRAWFESGPSWLHVHHAQALNALLTHLDRGEHEALSIAGELTASLFVSDDAAGRRAAQGIAGLRVSGTLGVLYQAALQGHLGAEPGDGFDEAVTRLRETNFFFNARLDEALRALSQRLHLPPSGLL